MTLVPIMASRFMISLKKAGSEPTELRSLPAIDFDPTSSTSNESVRFAPQVLDGSHGISGTSPTPNQADMELDSTFRWPRDRESPQLC